MGYWSWLKKNIIDGLHNKILLSVILVISGLFTLIPSIIVAIKVNVVLGAGILILALLLISYGFYITSDDK